MAAMESLTHAKGIFALASELMPSSVSGSSKIDWATEDEDDG